MVYYIYIICYYVHTKIAQIITGARVRYPGMRIIIIQVLPAGTYNGSVPEGMCVHSVPAVSWVLPGMHAYHNFTVIYTGRTEIENG